MRSRTESTGYRVAPVLTLIFLAPLIASVLPGAMRLSAMFAFPIAMGIWGCGAVLIRAAVRHWRLGWLNLLFLALALSIAEECIIHQTSLAPLIWQPPGEHIARVWGVNYLYFLWALGHEVVFAVFVPIALTELIFKADREQPWLGKWSAVVLATIFLLICLMAWYSWTKIARPMVFHVPIYNPPFIAIAVAAAAILLLISAAIGPFRYVFPIGPKPLLPASTWLLGLGAFVVSGIWHGLVLLSFGFRPSFPPLFAVGVGIVLVISVLWLLPRYAAHANWRDQHTLSIVIGVMTGMMALSFVAFIYGSLKLDLYGKIILNLAAMIFLIYQAVRLRRAAGLEITAPS